MFTKKKCIVVLLSVFALYLYGCGDGHVIPTSEQKVSGKLAQGYVHGATTWADKLTTATTGNFTIDTDEESTEVKSNVDGSYTMTIPANYGDYVIVSTGGSVYDSNGDRQAAATMMAPAPGAGEGATITVNLTPVTTLVALKPDLADKIANYGDDIAATSGADAGLVQLAKTVESILSLLTDSETGVVNKDNLASQMDVIAEVADKISDSVESASDLDTFLDTAATFSDVIETAVNSGLTAIQDEFRDDVVVSDLSTIATSIGTAVETVSNAIQDASSGGTVTESSVLNAVETAVGTAETAIDTVVASAFVTIGTPSFSTATIFVTFSPVNDTGSTQTYTGASLKVRINDNPLTARYLDIEITDLTVSIDTSSITIAATANSKVLITGKNKSGTTKVDMNLSGAGSYFAMSGNTMTLYMDNVESALTTAYPNSVLLDINESGKYTIDIDSSGFPLDAKYDNITVP